MNTEILKLAEQVKEAYEGAPWFGKSATQLLLDTTVVEAYVQPAGQHSILELVWHMVNWKRFVINRLRWDDTTSLQTFEEEDWRTLDHNDEHLWQQGLQLFHQTHNELVEVLQQQTDDLFNQPVAGRSYRYHALLHGILHHDVYHLGQIAYIQKLLRAQAGNA
jgi:hypothetical protein